MKQLGTQIIPKSITLTGEAKVSSSLFIRDEKLYLLGGYDKGSKNFAIFFRMDLKSMKAEQINLLEKGEIKNIYPPDPPSTLWFESGFIVNYLETSGIIMASKIQTNLQELSYLP